jgi:hydrogenase nickel incorporation protein HypB
MSPTNVPIVERIMNANDRLAEQIHARLNEARVFGLNIMASPGAGKTSTILATIQSLISTQKIAVIEGDTAPVTIDADKMIAAGVPAVQINTGGGCHLDASMLENALNQLALKELDLLIIENVGNLVCPASFQLGSHANVLIASIPEGDDKPYKYPKIYRGIQALILNKMDLLPYVPFDVEYFKRGVEMLNPGIHLFPISCKTGEGIPAWISWLTEHIQQLKQKSEK